MQKKGRLLQERSFSPSHTLIGNYNEERFDLKYIKQREDAAPLFSVQNVCKHLLFKFLEKI